jgi:hypothetical protein
MSTNPLYTAAHARALPKRAYHTHEHRDQGPRHLPGQWLYDWAVRGVEFGSVVLQENGRLPECESEVAGGGIEKVLGRRI